MRKITILSFAAVMLILMACSGNRERGSVTVAEQTELPPSLAPEVKISMVELTERQQQELQIQTETVTSSLVEHLIAAPGVVFPAPDHVSIISVPISGQISRINKYEGDWVREGEVLFNVQSLEFGTLVSEYLQAYAEEQFQSNRLKRMKQLVEETISSVSELERATAEYQRSSASVRAAYSKLRALGVLDEEIESLIHDESIDPVLKIHSPISGMIEKNFVEQGQSVNELENLSRVLDARIVLVRGYVSPDDARLINRGDTVKVMRRQEDLASIIEATISSINPGLDENSRSVIINIIVPTIDNWPQPGENVRLEVASSSKKEIIAIPVEALSYDGNQAVVFVQKSPLIFEKRAVGISEIGARQVYVESGLKEGERVASSNVFSLKALSRFDIISED